MPPPLLVYYSLFLYKFQYTIPRQIRQLSLYLAQYLSILVYKEEYIYA